MYIYFYIYNIYIYIYTYIYICVCGFILCTCMITYGISESSADPAPDVVRTTHGIARHGIRLGKDMKRHKMCRFAPPAYR